MNILRNHHRFTLQHAVFILLCSLIISSTSLSIQAADRASLDIAPNMAQDISPGIAKQSPLEQCYNAAKLSQPAAAQAAAGLHACSLALRESPLGKKSRAQVYIHRGVLYKKIRQPELALRDFYRAKRVAGNSPALSINIGNVYYLKRDFNRAIAAYDAALAMNFSAPHKALLNRGLANERLGRHQHAISAYASALAIEPSLTTARERLQALTTTTAALAYSNTPLPAINHRVQPMGYDTAVVGASADSTPIDIVALAAR